MSLELYAVVRDDPDPNYMPQVRPTKEHAERLAALNELEYPSLAPYRVVRLVEQEAA